MKVNKRLRNRRDAKYKAIYVYRSVFFLYKIQNPVVTALYNYSFNYIRNYQKHVHDN